jgi:hypothetical protein
LYKNNVVGGSTHLYHAVADAETDKEKIESARWLSLRMFTTRVETNWTIWRRLHDAEIPV